jgi:hypothetical protein
MIRFIGLALASLIIFLANSNPAQATVWRINNQGDGDFASLQAAHDSPDVVDGDTIQVEPSPRTYGSLTMNKRLILLGGGYFLSDNFPNLASSVSASIGNLQLDRAREDLAASGASGTVVSSIRVSGQVLIEVSNVVLRRNRLDSGIIVSNNGVSNLFVLANYISREGIDYQSNGSNILIRNNYIKGPINGDNLTVSFNTIANAVSNHALTRSSIRNNIFLSADSQGDFSGDSDADPDTDNTRIDNLCACTQLDNFELSDVSGASNVNDLFDPAAQGSRDARYQPNSDVTYPAELGMFSDESGDPYILSGIPPVPFLFELEIVGQPTLSEGLRVRVRARGGQ